jgi:predicted ATPase
MLHSLHISNYRNLKDLTIPSLSRVNLITGRNNTGKSTVLEAIGVYATKGATDWIYQTLEERGENCKPKEAGADYLNLNIRTLSSLFTDGKVEFAAAGAIRIGGAEDALPEQDVSLRFVKYMEKTESGADGNIVRKVIVNQKEEEEQAGDYRIGFEIKAGDRARILSLDEYLPYRNTFRRADGTGRIQFVRARHIDKGIDGNLFDAIALTGKEAYVIEALKIIEPSTERIAFVEESRGERSAVIKLSGLQRVWPLQSMGDGMNRMLSLILALVNAGDGFLLIDEFENGLHYTVQKQLWQIIFSLARTLHTQVFVTTHSNDCIKGFEQVLNGLDHSSEGRMIRLDSENGRIKQVEFSARELFIANDQHIEIR